MMDNATLYSWQANLWQSLTDTHQKNRLPHALLFTGVNGIGKRQFARLFSYALLCNEFQKIGKPCSQCQACLLVQAGHHPDLLWVESEPRHAIKVDQIREVTDFVNQTALLGGYRVVVISPAHAMNIYAANALLKTLEEPAPKTIFILVSDQHLRLPATILSRSQKIIFPKPETMLALAFLQENITDASVDVARLLALTQGAPLAALDFYTQGKYALRQAFYQGLEQLGDKKADPIDLAEQLHENPPETILEFLTSWLRDIWCYRSTNECSSLINSDFSAGIMKSCQQWSTTHLNQFTEHLCKINRCLREGHNFNQRLFLEELLIQWTRYAIS